MTQKQRERLVRLIGYIEGLQFAVTDDGVGEALQSVVEVLEEFLEDDKP